MFGVHPRVPLFTEEVCQKLNPRPEQLQQLAEARAKLTRPPQTKKSRFKLDENVWIGKVIKGNKLEPKFDGPLRVTGLGPNDTYYLTDKDGYKYQTLVSGDRLKRYVKAKE